MSTRAPAISAKVRLAGYRERTQNVDGDERLFLTFLYFVQTGLYTTTDAHTYTAVYRLLISLPAGHLPAVVRCTLFGRHPAHAEQRQH